MIVSDMLVENLPLELNCVKVSFFWNILCVYTSLRGWRQLPSRCWSKFESKELTNGRKKPSKWNLPTAFFSSRELFLALCGYRFTWRLFPNQFTPPPLLTPWHVNVSHFKRENRGRLKGSADIQEFLGISEVLVCSFWKSGRILESWYIILKVWHKC